MIQDNTGMIYIDIFRVVKGEKHIGKSFHADIGEAWCFSEIKSPAEEIIDWRKWIADANTTERAKDGVCGGIIRLSQHETDELLYRLRRSSTELVSVAKRGIQILSFQYIRIGKINLSFFRRFVGGHRERHFHGAGRREFFTLVQTDP